MSKFKRIISLLLAIVSFCVLELANPLQTLAEELNQPPTAETAVGQEIEEPNSLPSMESQDPSLVASWQNGAEYCCIHSV